MKPRKAVTLIDLDGKPIKHKYDNLSGISCRCESESVFGQVIAYEVLIGNCVVFSGKADDRELARKLVDFLNDQLTFIRNGMWETLAIYQATLGRYWEVPWFIDKAYENLRTTPTPLYDKVQSVSGGDLVFQPALDVFLKYYPDVFSKLTPWKEESTDSTH